MSAPTRQLADLADPDLAALLFAIDPPGLGGVTLRSLPSLEREDWLRQLRGLFPPATPWRKIPVNVSRERLLGGLDVVATLENSKPVVTRGILAECDGGVAMLAMAERLPAEMAAMIASVLDHRQVRIERDGIAECHDSCVGVVALDEGIDEDERLVPGLRERLAFHVSLDGFDGVSGAEWNSDRVEKARALLPRIEVPEPLQRMLAETAVALGVASARGELFALRAARAAAAADGCMTATDTHAAIAGRLALAVRAERLPAAPEVPESPDPPEVPDEANAEQAEDDSAGRRDIPDDVVLEATLAALPPGLLEQLQRGGRTRNAASGRSQIAAPSARKGRRVGTRRVESLHGARLDILATLKSAAPWQRLRGADAANQSLRIHKDDLRAARYEQRAGTTTVFVVDASGSQAAQRLGEVKAAVELLLSECYVRRDQVALIAFRGEQAEVVLPPTRALARARRSLAALPAGGPTPLAAGIDSAREMAERIRSQGRAPVVVLLTDGRSNVARDGAHGREKAAEEALAAARLYRTHGADTLLVDTARRPKAGTRELAAAMGARYVELPFPEANAIKDMVRARVA
jgi:magnesium chelatase subunit D